VWYSEGGGQGTNGHESESGRGSCGGYDLEILICGGGCDHGPVTVTCHAHGVADLLWSVHTVSICTCVDGVHDLVLALHPLALTHTHGP